jgi:hypothetical protein
MSDEQIIIMDRYGKVKHPRARIGTKARKRIEEALKLLEETERVTPYSLTVEKVLENYKAGLVEAEDLAAFALAELADGTVQTQS